jgi:hypothetical protein
MSMHRGYGNASQQTYDIPGNPTESSMLIMFTELTPRNVVGCVRNIGIVTENGKEEIMDFSVYGRTDIIRGNPNLLLSVNHHKDRLTLNLLLGGGGGFIWFIVGTIF